MRDLQHLSFPIDITGDLDGYAIVIGGERLAVFPLWEEVSEAYRSARDALPMLAACLAKAPKGAV